ncbi:MAG: arginine repressor [Ruminococcaceae bacterium]|nr:arginine repressor [Oscillospiraceae bacterium]
MKQKRQMAILDFIEKEEISTQEELTLKLKNAGFKVTQATVSRDIKELKLIKVHSDKKGNKYSRVASEISKNSSESSMKLFTIINEAVSSVDYANNIVIIRTIQGMAQGVAFAIDNLHQDGVMGTIAGDDTIIIVTKTEEHARKLVYKINNK